MAVTTGTYRAKACGEVVLGTSSQKGTPFIELYFQITEGDNKGGKVRWTSYFSEKTNERSIESLQYCGWRGEDLSEFADGGLHGLDANEVEIVVELEEYQTKETTEKPSETRVSPKVQWVNRAGGYLNLEAAMNPQAAESFGERMRGLVLAMRAKKPLAPVGSGTDFAHGANVETPPAANGVAPAATKPKAF
jgi:hypothetical protein